MQNRLENLANLRKANGDGAFANAFGALSAGAVLIGFVKYLGGSDIWIGLLAGVPSVLGLLQIPGAICGRRFATYKRFVTPGGLLWRLFYLPLIGLPYYPVSAALKLTIMILCVGVASASVLIVNSTYNEWLADLVPPSSRGYFYSRRNAITTLTGAVAGLIGGVIVDVFKSNGHERMGFSTAFALGSLCAFISFYFYSRMSETTRPMVVRQSLGQALRELAKPLVHPNFRLVLLFAAASIFGQTFAGNFFTAFALESLRLPFTILTLLGVCQATGTVVSSPFWGFLADKYGNKPILILSGFLTTVTPVMWLFCYPNETGHNAAVLLPMHVVIGTVWAGVSVGQFNILLATSPAEDRASYLGVALAVQAVTGFISPMLGAKLMATLRLDIPDTAHAYKMLFITTMGFRFLSVFFLIPVFEEGATRVRTTLRDISKLTPTGFRAMRKLSRTGDVSAREQAIRSVGQHKLSLAGDEIIKALHDPSPRIRRQAASSLARLGEASAVEALLHMLDEHPDLVEEETVEALGSLGGPEAVGSIVKLLKDPRSLVRRAAARALGRIGEPSAIPMLEETARDPGDADLRRASLRALRVLGGDVSAEVFADALLDPSPSVRIAAAEGVADLKLSQVAPQLRKSMEEFDDEASSELAYALGKVGTDIDIPLILETGAKCRSIITRRRCLLGLSSLLGVERSAYRLLLSEGLARDSAVLDMAGPLAKKNRRFAVALQKFSAGDEAAALDAVANAAKQPILQWMARMPVEELFLVVVCYLAGGKKPASAHE